MDKQPHESASTTDSPWFWLIVFLCGALVALVLTEPKYRWRQPQLERQYQAREISGQTVAPASGRRPLSTTGHPQLTLRPLMIFLVVTLAFVTMLYWADRTLRRNRRRT